MDDEVVAEFAARHLPWRLEVRRDAPLIYQVTALGEQWVVSSNVSGMLGERGAAEIRRTEGEFLAVVLVRGGQQVITQNGRRAICPAGGGTLWDSVTPAESYSPTGAHKSTLFIARDLIANTFAKVDNLTARPLTPSPTLKLLFSWIDTVTRQQELDASAAAAAGRVTIDLVTTALGGEPALTLDSQSIRLLEIKSFIESNLCDPALSVHLIATATAMSTRYVFRLFQQSGESCREYIMRERLRRARQSLLDTGLTVTEIAHSTGFDSPSSFSRSFRQQYGLSPTEARAEARAGRYPHR